MRSSQADSAGFPATLGPVLGLVLVFLAAMPAAGHTTLDFASPGPGMRVSGDIESIRLGFADPVFDPVVGLTSPSGAEVEGTVAAIDDRTIEFRMERLTEPGEYVVRYRVTAPDDDDQPDLTGAYAFSYLGGSGTGGSNWLYLAAVFLVLASVGGLIAWRVMRLPPPDQSAASD